MLSPLWPTIRSSSISWRSIRLVRHSNRLSPNWYRKVLTSTRYVECARSMSACRRTMVWAQWPTSLWRKTSRLMPVCVVIMPKTRVSWRPLKSWKTRSWALSARPRRTSTVRASVISLKTSRKWRPSSMISSPTRWTSTTVWSSRTIWNRRSWKKERARRKSSVVTSSITRNWPSSPQWILPPLKTTC